MNKWGNYYKDEAFVVEKQDVPSKHRFGGCSWRIVDECGFVDDKAHLILVFDLTDPKLSWMNIPVITELPICSYLNSNIWDSRQIYKFDEKSKTVIFVDRKLSNLEVLPEDCKLPNPLQEQNVFLRSAVDDELPLTEELYWSNIDNFIGGSKFIRVSGKPLWISSPEYIEEGFLFICCIGYERFDISSEFVNGKSFFFGEGALYFFFEVKTRCIHVISQST